MNRLFAVLLAGITFAPGAAPPDRADRTQPGVIRVWGDPAAAGLLTAWETAYRRLHPEIRFENRLVNTAMGMPGLYTGIADLAILGREPSVEDHDGFLHVRAYEPVRWEIATGSLATAEASPALVALVHPDNPLDRITLRQLDAAIGCECRRGGAPISTWGDLGLGGAWSGRPVHVYTFDLETGTGEYLIQRVFGGSRKLRWDRVREFTDNAALLRALAADPDGLALANLGGTRSGVKPLALADETRPSGQYVLPTDATLADGSYPLARSLLAFADGGLKREASPKTRAFVDFVRGPEGQAIVASSGIFLPLQAASIRKFR